MLAVHKSIKRHGLWKSIYLYMTLIKLLSFQNITNVTTLNGKYVIKVLQFAKTYMLPTNATAKQDMKMFWAMEDIVWVIGDRTFFCKNYQCLVQ